MTGGELLLLGGVFLGGAAPWLEAVVVIPIGIVAGMHPVLAVIVGLTGNLITVALAAWFGQRLRRWWTARRRARGHVPGNPDGPADDAGSRRARRWRRIERVMRRWGMPALAVLGPIGLGTQVTALVAVSLGVRARAAFLWVGAGTLVWSVIAAYAAVTGLNFAGVGA